MEKEYFVEKAAKLLLDHYEFMQLEVSQLLVSDVWKKCEFSYLEECLTLEQVVDISSKENAPEQLVSFLNIIQSLNLRLNVSADDPQLWGMTPKKSHEVNKLIPLISELNPQNIVEVGCGRGYLTHHIAEICMGQVLGIDRQKMSCYTEKDRNIRTKAVFRTETVDENSKLTDKSHSLLCALHACGDFSCSILNIFRNNSDFQSLVLVSCCYNLMDPEKFPLSNAIKQSRIKITKSMLKAACQVPFNWKNDKDAAKDAIRKHVFRACLGKLLHENGHDSALKVGTLPKDAFGNYNSYVRCVCTKFNLNIASFTPPTDAINARVAAYWFARCHIGIIIENLIIYDRMLFLRELRIDAKIETIFDSAISPRNLAIIAKGSGKQSE